MELNESQKEKKRIISSCIAGNLSTLQASLQLAITQRAVQKTIQRVNKYGDKAYINGHTGQKRINPEIEKRKKMILDIFLKKRNQKDNPFKKISYMYFSEVLEEDYNIKSSVSWIKKILNEIGYFTYKKYRKNKKGEIHLFRPRKEHFGELIQADGTSFDWFGNGHKYCIQGFIDDATGIPTGLYMTKNECLLGYVEAFREMSISYGIPYQLYPDKAGIFFVNNNKTEEKKLTQFGKMMDKLGVDMFPAHSPEAKGRIERFWQTLQNQLPVQIKLNKLNTPEEVNKYLREKYIPHFNKRHAVKAKSEETMFVKADMKEINSILIATATGKTDKSGVFSLQGYKFFCPELPNQAIKICLSEKYGIWITPKNKNTRYEIKLIETDTSGTMPEVTKLLIEKTFLQNAKPLYREVYYDIDEDVMVAYVQRKTA